MDMNGVLQAILSGDALTVTTAVDVPSGKTNTRDENGAWEGAYDARRRAVRVVFV